MRDGAVFCRYGIGWFSCAKIPRNLIFLAICLRLIDLVEPLISQVIIDRMLPFAREATRIVVVAISRPSLDGQTPDQAYLKSSQSIPVAT